MSTYYRSLIHLKRREDGRVEVWGGPIWAISQNFIDDEQRDKIAFVQRKYASESRRGLAFKAELVLAGVEVVAVERFGDFLALILPKGSRILIGEHAAALQEEAADYGLPLRVRPRVEIPSRVAKKYTPAPTRRA